MSRMNNDTISRQAAIDAIEKVDDYGDGIAFEVLSHAQRDISLLPSAERRGQWIEEYSANHFQAKCSACGESTLYGITYDLEGNAYYMNYCPNCGARMEGGE